MIAFTSRTGNVKYIVNKLGLPSIEISSNLTIHESYFLLTYTDGLGDNPKVVNDFLENKQNQYYLKGVIVTGNINFGNNFCKNADTISTKYNIPIIRKIDLRGTQEDLDQIKIHYDKLLR